LLHQQSIKQTVVLDSVGSAHFNRHILAKLTAAPGVAHRGSSLICERKTMKIVVGTLAALLLSGVLVSSEAEARCWWNAYNHCRY
jgi:hypothetical protein